MAKFTTPSAHNQKSFSHFIIFKLRNLRIIHLVILLLLLTITISAIVHYFAPQDTINTSNVLNQEKFAADAFDSLKGEELKERINELLAIKASIRDEIRSVESRRAHLQAEISEYSVKVNQLKTLITQQQQTLNRLNLAIEQAKFAEREAREQNTPEIKSPNRILPDAKYFEMASKLPKHARSHCRMDNCFDYSRCSITSQFPIFMYSPDDLDVTNSQSCNAIKTVITEALQKNVHLTYNPTIACIYVVVICNGMESPADVEQALHMLPYWNGDGRNHVIFGLHALSWKDSLDKFYAINIGRAILVQSGFTTSLFRSGFDIVAPPFLHTDNQPWRNVPPLSPAKRKYLLSFEGQFKSGDEFATYSREDKAIVETLKLIAESNVGDVFYFKLKCDLLNDDVAAISEWQLCNDVISRSSMLSQSTFSLMILPSNRSIVSTSHILARLLESLMTGAVPVILGGDRVQLPLQEFIDWKKAVLLVPKNRITELHFMLRAMVDTDLLYMRRQGRYIWQTYFSNPERTLGSVLACLRMRLGIPPTPIKPEPSPNIYFRNNQSAAVLHIPEDESTEILGPVEPPFPSQMFVRNYSQLLINWHDIWNKYLDPFHLYPSLPYDPVLPSEAKFLGSSKGFRPIHKGEGGTGKEFSQALGGNYPREQFTIVMLTYERENVLIDALEKFHNLPNLNKIVVVWNSRILPSESFRWPQIHVPIHVVKPKKNSLNNRFLPYEAIETDAILSIDDDAHLRHDEITFGFRVWREGRDRIVGFPGRYHAWDVNNGGWLYNSNYSCELSMVLTGAAFFHKYYAYQFSYFMPQVIRDKVDEYMNCEDIAINFLVSHITRKPPLKVTSRWTFRCPGCPIALSEDDSHFQERHKCMQFFTEVYGYMPLLSTQFRVDSVLFKTRLPQDKQKCFKYI